MGQQHFYVSDDVEEAIRQKAKSANMPVSRFLAELVKREVLANAWPPGYFESIFGQWEGEPLVRPDQGNPESRESLE